MYILNVARAKKKVPVNEIRDFIFENYYKRTVFYKEISYYSMKRFKKRLKVAWKQINRKIPDPYNAMITINHLLQKPQQNQ